MDSKTINRRKDFAATPTDPLRSVGNVASIASFGLFVIVLAKYVDGRYHRDIETSAQESLVSQSADQQSRLERFQSESNRMQSELKSLDEQSISYTELTQVQDQLLALARKHGCTLKKTSPRAKGTIDFKPVKSSQGLEPNLERTKDAQEDIKAEFELHQAALALNVSGDLVHILSFLKAVREQTWIASADQLTLRREGNTAGNMCLELELVFMSLQRKKSGEFGDSPGPRA